MRVRWRWEFQGNPIRRCRDMGIISTHELYWPRAHDTRSQRTQRSNYLFLKYKTQNGDDNSILGRTSTIQMSHRGYFSAFVSM